MYYNLHITTDSQLPNYYRAFYYETGKEMRQLQLEEAEEKACELMARGAKCDNSINPYCNFIHYREITLFIPS